MNKITLKAPAKINLILDVLDKRPDNYHNIKTIMHSINLCDVIALEKAEKTELITNACLPVGNDNIAVKAAEAFGEKVKITLEKNIPIAAGMAGGSTDAAAVLKGMNTLFGNRYSKEELCSIGKTIGADIPFCIIGGTALCEGIGEIITQLPALPPCFIVTCTPQMQISTAYIYSAIEKLEYKRPDTKGMLEALNKDDLSGVCARLFNVMEALTSGICPDISTIKQILTNFGALGAVQSGSGPTVFGIFDCRDTAQKAYEKLKQKYAGTFLTSSPDRCSCPRNR